MRRTVQRNKGKGPTNIDCLLLPRNLLYLCAVVSVFVTQLSCASPSWPTNINQFQSHTAAKPEITLVQTEEDLKQAKAIITREKVLAVDCEGVNLSRKGSICIVQVGTPTQCFILDLLSPDRSSMIPLLRAIMEDSNVVKIMHDCKLDADALQHLLGINIVGVHDTQACDNLLHKRGFNNLNTVLEQSGCCTNIARDKSVYKTVTI